MIYLDLKATEQTLPKFMGRKCLFCNLVVFENWLALFGGSEQKDKMGDAVFKVAVVIWLGWNAFLMYGFVGVNEGRQAQY